MPYYYRRGKTSSAKQLDRFDNYIVIESKKPGSCSKCSKLIELKDKIAWLPSKSKVICNDCYSAWRKEVLNERNSSCDYDY